MRKLFYGLALVVTSTGIVSAQEKVSTEYKPKLGLKAGYNWSYVTGEAEGLKKDNKNGFMVGAFYSAPSKGLGYRSEIVFSRQGYSFDDGGKNTEVQNDYIYLPQLTTFTIAKKLQLQAGAQIGFLLNAKKTQESKDSSLTSLMNRIDYGFAAGVEIYPFKGLLIGGRYNLGLGKLYKRYEEATTAKPYPLPFNPETTNLKNGLIQLFVGYRF